MKRLHTKSNAGFTLIEIMLVIISAMTMMMTSMISMSVNPALDFV